jgi:hypothetical protein
MGTSIRSVSVRIMSNCPWTRESKTVQARPNVPVEKPSQWAGAARRLADSVPDVTLGGEGGHHGLAEFSPVRHRTRQLGRRRHSAEKGKSAFRLRARPGISPSTSDRDRFSTIACPVRRTQSAFQVRCFNLVGGMALLSGVLFRCDAAAGSIPGNYSASLLPDMVPTE